MTEDDMHRLQLQRIDDVAELVRKQDSAIERLHELASTEPDVLVQGALVAAAIDMATMSNANRRWLRDAWRAFSREVKKR